MTTKGEGARRPPLSFLDPHGIHRCADCSHPVHRAKDCQVRAVVTGKRCACPFDNTGGMKR